jgi:hypothetical protein
MEGETKQTPFTTAGIDTGGKVFGAREEEPRPKKSVISPKEKKRENFFYPRTPPSSKHQGCFEIDKFAHTG